MLRIERRRHTLQASWTYPALDRHQREIAAEVRAGASGAILLSEVSPVITLGRRATESDLLLSRDFLAAKGVELCPVDRGGLATWHGPGQWVLFVVERLERLTGDPRGVKLAVQMLLEVACEVGRQYQTGVHLRSATELGAWTGAGKFAAVGVHVADGVLLHGLSVNGYRSPGSFEGLRPCGLEAPVGYLLGSEDASEFEDLGDRLETAARKVFSTPARAPHGTRQRLTDPRVEAISEVYSRSL